MSLWGEIRRRNVHRVALAYVAAAWLLIQVVETLFPVFGLSENSIRVIVILLGVGFIPAVVLSWVFEWTPEGLRRDSDVTAPAPAARTRRFDAAIIATLVLAVAYFAVDKGEAFRLLDRHFREDTWQIRDHLTRPWYKKLHDDPRWQALLEQYDMNDEKLASLDIRLPPAVEL